MKPLILNGTTVQHLAFFNDKDDGVCTDFCRVATNFLEHGINAKLYSTAAAKLGVDVEDVRHAVEAIMHILIEAAKIKAKESDLRDALGGSLRSADLIGAIEAAYADVAQILRQTLDKTPVSDVAPEYKSLEWRLEVEVASRVARQIHRPVVTFHLATTSSSDSPNQSAGAVSNQTKVEEQLLQTDASTLVQITQDLENALKEMKTREFRKLANQLSK